MKSQFIQNEGETVIGKKTCCLPWMKIQRNSLPVFYNSTMRGHFYRKSVFSTFSKPCTYNWESPDGAARISHLPYAATGNRTHGSRVAPPWGTFKGLSTDWATRPRLICSKSWKLQLASHCGANIEQKTITLIRTAYAAKRWTRTLSRCWNKLSNAN